MTFGLDNKDLFYTLMNSNMIPGPTSPNQSDSVHSHQETNRQSFEDTSEEKRDKQTYFCAGIGGRSVSGFDLENSFYC